MLTQLIPAAPLAQWVAGVMLKATAVLLAAGALVLALRRASAAIRHLVWSAAVVAVLVLPFLSVALPHWSVIPVTRSPLASSVAAKAPPTDRDVGREAVTDAATPVAERPAAATPPFVASAPPASGRAAADVSPAMVLLALWLGVVALLLGRLAVGAFVLDRAVRRAVPLTTPDWTHPLVEAADRLALPRLPRLFRSARLPMPFAYGVVRPAIVLPETAEDWTDRRRRAVLCHELAHVRRLDLLLNVLAQVACALWWFHPLMWVAARRVRLESERACDDLVLGVGTRASEYADHLLHIVCTAARVPAPAAALPMAQRREFEGRLLAILERGAPRHQATLKHAATLGALSLGLILPLTAVGLRERGPATEGAPAVPTASSPRAPSDPAAAPVPPPAIADGRRDSSRASTPPTPSASRSPSPSSSPSTSRSPAPAPPTPTLQQDTAGVIAALTNALLDSVPRVREDAAYALGQLEAKAAVKALGERLLSDREAKVRWMAGWSLGQIESREATGPLGSAALRDSSEEVRGIAVWALGQLGDPAAVTALAGVVHDDRSSDVRGRAAWALGQIGAEPAPAGLIAALEDATPEVRYRAAWALGQIADPRAAAPLQAALADTSKQVRRAAFWALGQIPGDAAQPALVQALRDPDPDIRAAAARALAGHGGQPWPWPWPWPIVR